MINTDGRLDEPLAFHQMLDSAANGILVAGVRAYDATTGRFLSADPLELAAAPSPLDAGDFFRYAQDNPIAMHDATGLAPCLMTAEGGCRSNLGEETYEEQPGPHGPLCVRTSRPGTGRARPLHRGMVWSDSKGREPL